MKTSTKCFWLRTALVMCICGAAVCLGAYTTRRLCVQMMLTPLCLLLAYAAYKAEQFLWQQEYVRRAARRRMCIYAKARAAALQMSRTHATADVGYACAQDSGEEAAENELFTIKSRRAS